MIKRQQFRIIKLILIKEQYLLMSLVLAIRLNKIKEEKIDRS